MPTNDPSAVAGGLAAMLNLARVQRDWKIPADRRDVAPLSPDHEANLVAEHGIEALWVYYCTAPMPGGDHADD